MAASPAGRMLARQLQQMQSDKDIPGISCGLVDNNVFEWEVMLMISDDVKLYGGMCLIPLCADQPGVSDATLRDCRVGQTLFFALRWRLAGTV